MIYRLNKFLKFMCLLLSFILAGCTISEDEFQSRIERKLEDTFGTSNFDVNEIPEDELLGRLKLNTEISTDVLNTNIDVFRLPVKKETNEWSDVYKFYLENSIMMDDKRKTYFLTHTFDIIVQHYDFLNDVNENEDFFKQCIVNYSNSFNIKPSTFRKTLPFIKNILREDYKFYIELELAKYDIHLYSLTAALKEPPIEEEFKILLENDLVFIQGEINKLKEVSSE